MLEPFHADTNITIISYPNHANYILWNLNQYISQQVIYTTVLFTFFVSSAYLSFLPTISFSRTDPEIFSYQ